MKRLAPFLAGLLLLVHSGRAAEYFVAPTGADTHAGTQREAPFRTIQKGVNALQPGDTLTIAPGEYHEAVHREGLGGEGAQTVIRAAIPGTVLLRGDAPLPPFRKVEGRRMIHVTPWDGEKEVQVVNELETATVLERLPNLAELEYSTGFYQDREGGKLYISSPDGDAAAMRHYTAGLIPKHGLSLVRPVRVVVEGLTFTGFNTATGMPRNAFSFRGVWGIFLLKPKACIVRDCTTYLNGHGIGLNMLAATEADTGDNVVEGCTSWANSSQFGEGDMGGISLYSPRRDAVRRSLAFLNKKYGIHIYHGWKSGLDPQNRSTLEDNVAWGNYCDFKIKTGDEYLHTVERSAGPGLWSVKTAISCLQGSKEKGDPENTISLEAFPGLDLDAEFAAPLHHDYRLQATSRFRGAGKDGRDLGPYPFESNVYFVGPQGDDAADGLAVSHAWKSIARAATALKPGDTLYLLPGTHGGGEWSFRGTAERPIRIASRGAQPAIVRGAVTLKDCTGLRLERVAFEAPVAMAGGRGISFHNGNMPALSAQKVDGLSLAHLTVAGSGTGPLLELSGCKAAVLAGNRFENSQGPAVQLDRAAALLHAADNVCANPAGAWVVGGTAQDAPSPAVAFSGDGHPVGAYTLPEPDSIPRLVAPLRLHSVSATTANLEWATSRPATCEIAWGPTAECAGGRVTRVVNRFGTFSLTGLEPGRDYYVRLVSLREPPSIQEAVRNEPPTSAVIPLEGEPLRLRTADKPQPPTRWYVAPDGDDANPGDTADKPWRTLQHAADRVNAGDTVEIGAGTYRETIRLRATGEKDAPITFRAREGEVVHIEGADGALRQGFVAGSKSHLRFDGLRFSGFNSAPVIGLIPLAAGELSLYAGEGITVSRSFSDGRRTLGGGARMIYAQEIRNLRIENCVLVSKMSGGISVMQCPDLLIEHTVFMRPKISALIIDNHADQPATVRNCIFTDMLKKKADLNISLLLVEKGAPLTLENNAFLIRSFPPEERKLLSRVHHPTAVVEQSILPSGTFFVDPAFAGAATLPPARKPGTFAPDRLADAGVEIDFATFFATEPEVVRRGIGLQRAAFPGDSAAP